MKFLLTGGCGFIGSHVADRILAGNCELLFLEISKILRFQR